MFHTVEEAIDDLKNGKVVIVVDDEDRENEGDFIVLSDKATPEAINFMIKHGRGLVCTAITAELAKKLDLRMMTDDSTDPFGTAFTVSIDHKSTKTGISAFERSTTIQAMIDPNANKDDFKKPGHVFPLIAKDHGVLVRPGHTEAAVDLAKLAGSAPSAVICEIVNEDGTMTIGKGLIDLSDEHDLKIITIADLITYRKLNEVHVKREIETVLPTAFGDFKIYGYSNDLDDKEHIALVKGDVDQSVSDEPVMVRVHSECLTGDVFGSHRCDCGPQLHAALEQIEAAGRGVVVYMRQEGRGIGLLSKLRAYELQDRGRDTYEANVELGFAPDAREYHFAAQILRDLGVSHVDLLTNNPDKMQALSVCGIHVDSRLPIQPDLRKENANYMETKMKKFGHLLDL